jgi:hypothetical protein
MTQGEVAAGTVGVMFTILHQDGEDRAVQAALAMIKGLRVR